MDTKIILSLFVLLTSLACNTVGPRALRTAQQPYNQALAETQDEEILLNLLRIAEGRKPQFLKIDKVTTSYKFSATAGVGATLSEPLTRTSSTTTGSDTSSTTIGRSDGNTDGFSANLGGTWQESPTVSYVPLTGEEFAKRILSPVSLENLALLYGAGYDGELLTTLFVSRAGELYGDSDALMDLARNIGILQENDYLELFPKATWNEEFGKEGPTKVFISWRAYEGFVPKETCEFICTLPKPDCEGGYESFCKDCLSLEDGDFQKWVGKAEYASKQKFIDSEDPTRQPRLPICPGSPPPPLPSPKVENGSEGFPKDASLIGTRSLTGAVRQALDIPARTSGVDLLSTCTPGGAAPRGILQLSCSSRRPDDSKSFVSVKYRGKWFFIPAGEEKANQTYLMLSLLYTMQAGKTQPSTSADIVIPVGGI